MRIRSCCPLFLFTLVLLITLGPPAATKLHAQDADDDSETDQPTELTDTLTIPLDGGQLQYGALLGALAEKVGVPARLITRYVDGAVKVDGVAGRLTMRTVNWATRGVMTFELKKASGKQVMEIRIDRVALRRQKSFIRNRVVRLIQAWFPDAAARAKAWYGLFAWQPDGTLTPIDDAALENKEHAVVLIHGLDEPGDVWSVLGPRLVKEGYTTIEFRYPNDQKIGKSARNFARHLSKLRAMGVERVTILAHSMGGLVSREMLTHPDYYAGQGAGHALYPEVQRLIMLGTPNHGSSLAKLRGFAEARETLIRLFSRDRLLFGGFFDGAGEAGEDLLPDSEFLTRLNARPLPEGVAITILAGRASPITSPRIEEAKSKLKALLNRDGEGRIDAIADALAKCVDGLGDGCVPLASTRLEGVDDHTLVRGNHTTMLLRTKSDSRGTPAAVKIILQRLETDNKVIESRP